MNNDTNTIKFDQSLVERLNGAVATANGAVAEAALAAVAQDKRISVRAFVIALRAVAPALGTANATFTAAVKAAKVKGATAVDVAEAMAQAIAKKRADDSRRAAEKRAAAPQKAYEKAQAKEEECKLALRTPLEVARDNVAAAEAAVRAAAAALDAAVKREDEARAELKRIEAEAQSEA